MAGNDALKFSAINVTNNSSLPAPDTTAPVLLAGMTSDDGTQITLLFDEMLGTVTAPAKSFTVAIGNTRIGVISVTVEGPIVILNLARTIADGQSIVVSYDAPKVSALTTNAAIQDVAGNDAIRFSNFYVENFVDQDLLMAYKSSEIDLVGSIFFIAQINILFTKYAVCMKPSWFRPLCN